MMILGRIRKCVGVRVVRPTGEKKKAGSKAMEPAR